MSKLHQSYFEVEVVVNVVEVVVVVVEVVVVVVFEVLLVVIFVVVIFIEYHSLVVELVIFPVVVGMFLNKVGKLCYKRRLFIRFL